MRSVSLDGRDKPDGVDICGYAVGHELGIAHGVDHCGGTVSHVAAGEHSFAGGHAVGILACQHVAFAVDLDPFGGGDYP